MATRLEIQNAVLIELGQNPIISPDENTYVNQLMRNIYPILVEQVMVQGNWTSLKARVKPVQVDADYDPQFDFTYQLPTLPAVLRVVEVRTDGGLSRNWEVQEDKLLSTDAVEQVVYIKRELEESKWDAHLTQTVVAGLKFSVAKALQESASVTQLYQQQFFALLQTNRAGDNSQASTDQFQSSRYTSVRGGSILNDLRVGRID